MLDLRFARLLFAFLFVASCDDDADGEGGQGQGASGQGASGQGGSGGAGTGGNAGDYAGYGSVGVYSSSYTAAGMPVVVSGAFAAYYLNDGALMASTCPRTEAGTCWLTDCMIQNGQGTTPTYVSAGTIDITGGQREISLAPGADNQYPPVSSSTASLFGGGEMILFDVRGDGDIPAHQATIAAPAPATITMPLLGTPVPVDRTQDLPVAWTGGTGDVVVTLNVSESDGVEVTRSLVLQCELDAAAGAGALPASLLGMLPPTSPMVQASFTASVVETADTEAGDYLVSFLATTGALTPTGELATGRATIQ
jgi:hypothetical protein